MTHYADDTVYDSRCLSVIDLEPLTSSSLMEWY